MEKLFEHKHQPRLFNAMVKKVTRILKKEKSVQENDLYVMVSGEMNRQSYDAIVSFLCRIKWITLDVRSGTIEWQG